MTRERELIHNPSAHIFTTYNLTKYNIPISNASLPIAIKPKAKYVNSEE